MLHPPPTLNDGSHGNALPALPFFDALKQQILKHRYPFPSLQVTTSEMHTCQLFRFYWNRQDFCDNKPQQIRTFLFFYRDPNVQDRKVLAKEGAICFGL